MVSVSAETILPTFDPRTSFGRVSCHWEPSHQIKPSILKVAVKIACNHKWLQHNHLIKSLIIHASSGEAHTLHILLDIGTQYTYAPRLTPKTTENHYHHHPQVDITQELAARWCFCGRNPHLYQTIFHDHIPGKKPFPNYTTLYSTSFYTLSHSTKFSHCCCTKGARCERLGSFSFKLGWHQELARGASKFDAEMSFGVCQQFCFL